ncbi:MAG TPA: hypothetical protein DCM64_05930 [Gammaproteobacteria bacterium]|jgi:quercetin dioxygenase-like cupin family protein|nr:hypothetical protein [Gammaproteobacteria bacterium]MDP6733678.1 hypothetical protein [Gammaproteobacteria bacterium]HAJ75976.1 hypothetical protein [Gammaproteobacteria bacterium]|tara:strand:+ start:591 stop:1322 length:732 start_codon:yes stop_codon:yes gene_type:complete
MSHGIRVLLGAVLLSGMALLDNSSLFIDSVLAQEQDYPHAFPRPGVIKLLDNERVLIWEVVWPDGAPAPYHRHQYDMTGVFLRWGPLRVTRLDGTYTDSLEPFEVPSVFFLEKGVTHKEEGIGTPERHSIMIDLKEYTVPAMNRRGDEINPFHPGSGEELLDNERLTINHLNLQTGQSFPLHYHAEDSVLVFLSGGTLRLISDDGQQEYKNLTRKDVWYLPRGQSHSLEVVSGSPEIMLYQLK